MKRTHLIILSLLIIITLIGVSYSNIFTIYSGSYTMPDDYDELMSWYQILENEYPEYIDIINLTNEYPSYGLIPYGYSMYSVRLTNEQVTEDKPEVIIIGGTHGDEYGGIAGPYWFTDWMVRHDNEENVSWILDNREIYIIPCFNPYGFDHPDYNGGSQRRDANNKDLNRDFDFNWYYSSTSYNTYFGSVNTKVLRDFINDHMFMTGTDIHSGAVMLLTPFNSGSPDEVQSPYTGEYKSFATPDFYFYDVSSHICANYVESFNDELLTDDLIGPGADTLWYEPAGVSDDWLYAGNSQEEIPQYLNEDNEGCGIYALIPEVSNTKEISESYFGSDDNPGLMHEIRRFLFYLIDMAQPSVHWLEENPDNLQWEVKGCLVVDETNIVVCSTPGAETDIVYTSPSQTNSGYWGGTHWDNDYYQETLSLSPGDTYYVYAKAKVDQIYKDPVLENIYGPETYLRIIKQRTDETFVESRNGQTIEGQLWWYSDPLIIGEPINGDASGNGITNSYDVFYLSMYILGDPNYQDIACDPDISGNGIANAYDIYSLAMQILE